MICDKIVLKDAKVAAEEPEEEEAAGYRIKNKNLTQRCGEKNTPKTKPCYFRRIFHIFLRPFGCLIFGRGESPPLKLLQQLVVTHITGLGRVVEQAVVI